jgi:16S rRNA (cytidine1402-2'-O)-methyltransferase
MRRQKSQQTSRKVSRTETDGRRTGRLFVVGTPIGSPDDLTLRARTILGQVSIVAAETPLITRALLEHHDIAARVTGYDGGDEEKIRILLDRLGAGHDIALVCDGGMPVIYDPGRLLIAAARTAGHPVTVIPGPSALTAAAALSGFSADRLVFAGRLPRSRRQLDRFISSLRNEAGAAVMFTPSSAVRRVLGCIRRLLPERTLMLAVNMTKSDERVYHGDAGALLKEMFTIGGDAEVTLVLSGKKGRTKFIGAGS